MLSEKLRKGGRFIFSGNAARTWTASVQFSDKMSLSPFLRRP
jgi:hypothetical protein